MRLLLVMLITGMCVVSVEITMLGIKYPFRSRTRCRGLMSATFPFSRPSVEIGTYVLDLGGRDVLHVVVNFQGLAGFICLIGSISSPCGASETETCCSHLSLCNKFWQGLVMGVVSRALDFTMPLSTRRWRPNLSNQSHPNSMFVTDESTTTIGYVKILLPT